MTGTFGAGTLHIYIDGQLAGSKTDARLGTPPTYDTQLGALGFDPTLGIDARVDEVMVFGRELTAPEVQTLYERGTI